MTAPLLIMGQGLAGTALGWALERAGVAFVIADAGHAQASARVGAGIINPVTGQRLVKSWGVDELLPVAREFYRSLETGWGVSVWREMRVRRWFASEEERRLFTRKVGQGALGAYTGSVDDTGLWIEGAARVDTAALIEAGRARWRAQGRLREQRMDWREALAQFAQVIDCTGAGVLAQAEAPWEKLALGAAYGEILHVAVPALPAKPALEPTVIHNRGHWLLPVEESTAWVGATYQRTAAGAVAWETRPSAAAGEELRAAASSLLPDQAWTVQGQVGGWRVTTPDRRPYAGWHPTWPRLGVCNGLGSKGALWAPWLAQCWVAQLKEGQPFPQAVSLGRSRPVQAPAD